MHGATSPGAPKGNRNALKHGLYSAEIIARRRKVAALLRGVGKYFSKTSYMGNGLPDSRMDQVRE